MAAHTECAAIGGRCHRRRRWGTRAITRLDRTLASLHTTLGGLRTPLAAGRAAAVPSGAKAWLRWQARLLPSLLVRLVAALQEV